MYIIASSKTWHHEECLKRNYFCNNNFSWVSNTVELNEAVVQHSNIDYIFFLHWNWLVPESIWSKHECVCFHMTDVPYGRGGSPLQNLIVRGHKATKLSALRMTAEMDAGPVYTKRTLSLEGTAHEIYLKAGELSYEIMVWMIDNNPQPIEQVGEPVIFHRRKPKDSMLPVGIEIPEIYDFIRMLDAPTYPHAFIEHGDFIIEFTDASIDCNELVANIRLRKKDQN